LSHFKIALKNLTKKDGQWCPSLKKLLN
jgi:hypothetical protein